jgi:hypothetical protein
MKHIQTFESYIIGLNEANAISKLKSVLPGVKFQEEEIEFDPEEGYKSVESYSFQIPGVDEPAYINIYDGDSFCFFYDAAPIATSLHSANEVNSMAQTQTEVPLPLNKLNKSILEDAIKNIKEYIGESVTNEANTSLGSKAKKFDSSIEEWNWFTDADTGGEDKLPSEWHDAVKKLGIKEDDAIVCFYDAVGSMEDVIDTAKRAGIKYVEVEGGDDGGSGGIVFSAKQ